MQKMSRNPLLSLLLPVLLLLLLPGCKSKPVATPPSANELPGELSAQYREDAARLALRELNTSRQSGERDAFLPEDRIQYFFELLSQAYWMSQRSDSIPASLQEIHTLKSPDLKRIFVVLKEEAEFKDNWASGRTTTGNLYLNQLLSKYKLKIRDYKAGAFGPTLTLESPVPVNTEELALALSQIEGIREATAEGMVGDGNDINWGAESKNRMALKFSIGAGDCPSGCIYRKYWVFYVSQTGEMDYMGTRGNIPKHLDK